MKYCKSIFVGSIFLLLFQSIFFSLNAQSLLWESNQSWDGKIILHNGGAKCNFFVQGLKGTWNFYNSNSLLLEYSIKISSEEIPMCTIDDINGNNHPETIIQDVTYPGYSIKIVDLGSGLTIFEETSENFLYYMLFTTVNDTNLKMVIGERQGAAYYLQVYSLDIQVNVEKNGHDIPSNLNQQLLSQNYPNPFNFSTNIQYKITEPAKVKLSIFDGVGRLVRNVTTEHATSGVYNFIWDGKNDNSERLSSGLYFYEIMIENKIADTKKMIMLR